MADVGLNPVFESFRRKIGDLVFFQRNGETFVRRKGQIRNPKSPEQLEVRNAFSSLVSDWKSMNGVMHAGWMKRAKNEKYSGYNLFIARNAADRREGRTIELFSSMGEEPLAAFAVQPGSAQGSVECAFTMEAGEPGRHLTVFARRKDGAAPLRRHDAGADPVSPVTVTNLEPGAEYEFYAVVTDAAYTAATKVSASSAAVSLTGN